MLRTYVKYIQNPSVRTNVEENKKVQGTTTAGTVGRPSTMPSQLGHDVKICGKYEYYLVCGRCTQASHIDTAKHIFWRRQTCTPVTRLHQYQDKQHKVGFDKWWYFTACEAKGPNMNNKFCTAYVHKQM